jgi:Sec-independent protein secretion pathway component TatC
MKSDKRLTGKMEDKMESLLLIVSVTVLFVIRIGIPVVILFSIGILIDRWQSRREKELPLTLHRRT